jgi:PAS domain S-box-containing protein
MKFFLRLFLKIWIPVLIGISTALALVLFSFTEYEVEFYIVLISFVLVILIFLLVGFLVYNKHLIQAFVQATEFSEKLIQGDLSGLLQEDSSILPVNSHYHALNDMKSAFVQQRLKNRELTVGLEFQVSKRTRELKSALEKLNEAQRIARICNFVYWIDDDFWEFSGNIQQILRTPEFHLVNLENFLAVLSPEARPEFKSKILDAGADSEGIYLDFKLLAADPVQVFWVSMIAQFELDPATGKRYVSGAFQDITNRKQIQSQVDQLSLVARLTTNGVIITDRERRILWVNAGIEKMTGYAAEELIGKNPRIFQSPNTNPEVRRMISIKLSSGENVRVEIENVSKSGNPYWIELHIQPIFDAYKNITGFLAIQVDVTERKIFEKNLQEALSKEVELNQMKSKFINMMSHEFRTPLTSVQTTTELLGFLLKNQELKDVERVERNLSRIITEVDRMTELMNDTLLLGRMEAGKTQFSPGMLDLVSLIDNLFNQRDIFPADERHIQVEISGIPRMVTFDRVMMEHILTNLASNALKYSKGKTSPLLKVQFNEDGYRLRFIDFGIGIPATEQNNLFQSFYRASNVENIQGTGLGLSIVKQFVDMHQGIIKVVSEEGKGTEVTLDFKYVPLTLNGID